MRWILEHNGDPNLATKMGDTPLMFAISMHQKKSVRLLLQWKANLHQVDSAGNAAIHIAAYGGHVEIVHCLLEQGADPNQRNSNNDTPLSTVASEGHVDVCEVLLQNGASISTLNSNFITPLQEAARFGHSAVVDLFLKHKPDLEVKDANGNTALLNAVLRGSLDCTRKILEAGAFVEACRKDGRNSLICTISEHYPARMLSLLLEFHANPNVFGPRGLPAVHLAVEKDTSEHLKVLAFNGAKLDQKDLIGRTPLLYAALKGKVDPVSELLRMNVGIHELDHMGRSLVHCAFAGFWDFCCMKEILERWGRSKRRLHSSDIDGWTPLHW